MESFKYSGSQWSTAELVPLIITIASFYIITSSKRMMPRADEKEVIFEKTRQGSGFDELFRF